MLAYKNLQPPGTKKFKRNQPEVKAGEVHT
jgi:hypothetical protein